MEYFIYEHWIVSAILVYSIIYAFAGIVTRFFRMLNILVRGWPPFYLDADGEPRKIKIEKSKSMVL